MITELSLQSAFSIFAFLAFAIFIIPRGFSWKIENGYFKVHYLVFPFSRVKISEIKSVKNYSFLNLPSNSVYFNMNANLPAHFFGKTVIIDTNFFPRFYAFYSFDGEKIQAALETLIKDRLEVSA